MVILISIGGIPLNISANKHQNINYVPKCKKAKISYIQMGNKSLT